MWWTDGLAYFGMRSGLGEYLMRIAALAVIPELHRPDARRDWRIAPPLFLGAGLIALLGRVVRAH